MLENKLILKYVKKRLKVSDNGTEIQYLDKVQRLGQRPSNVSETIRKCFIMNQDRAMKNSHIK